MNDAASHLGLSQPALTSHLKAFAGYFSEEVFAMQGRRKVLTPFGRRLAEELNTRLGGMESVVKTVSDEFAKPERVTVRIGGRAEILGLLAKRLEFAGSLAFYSVDGAAAIEGLHERRFELAISGREIKDQTLHRRKLFSEHFELMLPKRWAGEHAAGGKSQVTKPLLTSLLERPYLSYTPSDERLEELLAFMKIDARPRIAKSISNWERLIEMAELQQGWTIAPSRFGRESQKLACLPLPSGVLSTSEFYVIYRKESLSLPWFKVLLNQLLASV